MTKKYLIDETESHTRNGFRICEECDAREVEVFDWYEMELKFKHSKFLMFPQFARANNYLIVKIKE